MMKLFTKILAGCCALAMVFSLAACKDTAADEPGSTGDAAVNLSEATPGETVAQADDMSETAPEEDSAQTPADTEEAQSQNGQTPPSTEKNTAASPNSGKDLSKTEVLALYQAGRRVILTMHSLTWWKTQKRPPRFSTAQIRPQKQSHCLPYRRVWWNLRPARKPAASVC